MARKSFAPKPGSTGATIVWTHVWQDGTVEQRSGVIVGQAPRLGGGHKAEVWVVPTDKRDRDVYDGGVVVAQRAKTAAWGVTMPAHEAVPAGAWFSDDSKGAPTGGLAVTNARPRALQRLAEKMGAAA